MFNQVLQSDKTSLIKCRCAVLVSNDMKHLKQAALLTISKFINFSEHPSLKKYQISV